MRGDPNPKKRDKKKPCDHLPGEQNLFVRNITYSHVVVDGERLALGGYIERCVRCGVELPVLVG